MITNRRAFLGLVALAPFAAAASPLAAAESTDACYDPAALSLSQKSRRRAVEYVDRSDDPARHCGACSFFAGIAQACGNCAMLGGGPVSATGVCTSFALKPQSPA